MASSSGFSGIIYRLCSVDVAEVFSPPRVSSEAAKFGLMAGEAMDLTTGWGFNRKEDRDKAEEYVGKVKPLVLIGSPPCVAFSQLQSLIADSERKREHLKEGIRHMDFVAKPFKKQIDGRRVLIRVVKTLHTQSHLHYR